MGNNKNLQVKIDWASISPEDFESLCTAILYRQSFSNIQLIGGTGDRGRDIIANRIDQVSQLFQIPQKWVFQCKRYITKLLSIEEINKNILQARFHDPNFLVFIISNRVSPNVLDWLNTVKNDYKFEILIWDIGFLENFLLKEADIQKKYFGKDSAQSTIAENEIVFGEKPNNYMIYTAGKLSSEAVRDSITQWRKDLQDNVANYKLDIGFYHPEYAGCDHTGIWPEETVFLDTTMLKKSDYVIAYLNQDELYGTITEIMMAHYLNKKLAIFIDKTILYSSENDSQIYTDLFQTNHKCPCMLSINPEYSLNKYWFILELLSKNHRGIHIEVVNNPELTEKMTKYIIDSVSPE